MIYLKKIQGFRVVQKGLWKINNAHSFCELFLDKFLVNGFGAMPKRECEIYLLHLLLKDGQFKNEKGQTDFHEMSLDLKMTETKVRNLVYEIELKYQQSFAKTGF
ncbi:hypothetical protein J3998_02065 [Thiomicrorhabdus sp. 6S2-11]|uniref:Helix-turn-helix domain-containing protein n=1 Tax=Thiomicrorhabdus marina TaxID=2818442 RepID=A0ABS3Q3E1_9GAMM|nr:hypothetical protein [Thiomicrorhabdus marina]MBO1926350.1 hypothetical protein [Thiomicrorhabdus marina]